MSGRVVLVAVVVYLVAKPVNAESVSHAEAEDSSFVLERDADIYNFTDEEFYSMPKLFHMDDYTPCLATGGVYCMGTFELSAPSSNRLFRSMQRYSSDWVQHFNHTRLHRALCLNRRCPLLAKGDMHADMNSQGLRAWFASCVNTNAMANYNMSARLLTLDYCTLGERDEPLNTNEKAFAGFVAVLFALAVLSTTIDLSLSDHAKKGMGWALSWSVRQSWRSLTAPVSAGRGDDLRFFDGLRLFAMLCVILEHVGWLASLSYVDDTRFYEQARRSWDVMLLTNSTLVVQIFFIMASFLLANKLLQQPKTPIIQTFLTTMLNRLIRLSPSYFVVLWFATSWWERLGSGPQWGPLVEAEAAVCRRKLWTHLLYVNNLVYPDEKCLIQTWYLAADVQLYAVTLLLTLLLRGRRALLLLSVLLLSAALLPLALAYSWNLVPTYVVHSPESVRQMYSGSLSFNLLYQSPLGNAAAALAGLTLAFLHHATSSRENRTNTIFKNKIVWWAAACAPPAALLWAAQAPLLLPPGPPARLPAALLATLERPVFAVIVAFGMYGGLHGVDSIWRRCLNALGSGAGAVAARLSFGALLLHLPLNKALLASRHGLISIDRSTVLPEWFGVCAMSYCAALPLALLVELPALRLVRELAPGRRARAPPPAADKPAS